MRGRFGRRFVVCAVTAALVLAACGGDDDTGSGGGPGGESEVDPNGTVRYIFTVPASLDPALITGSVANLVYDTLLEAREPESGSLLDEPSAGLATSYEFAPDGTYLELQLRDDVTFHDGTPVDAEAVKVNIERQKTLPASVNVGALSSVDHVEVIDPQTVRLHLVPGKGAEVPWQLTQSAGMVVSPKALDAGQDIGLDPGDSGSGPFTVVSFTPGQSLVLERAEGGHWNPEVGMAKRLEMSFVGDQTARLNALRSHDTDIVFASHDAYPTVQDLVDQGVAVAEFTDEAVGGYGIQWHSTGDLADPLVREAANLAVDREAICETIMNGQCYLPETMQALPPAHWAYSDRDDIPTVEYDQDKARELLQEAGIPHPEITISQSPGLVTASYAPAVQADLEEVGFEVNLTSQPYTDAGAAFREGSLQAMSDIPSQPTPDPSIDVSSIYASGKRLVPEEDLPEFDELADAALDPKLSVSERAEAYGDLWKFVGDRYYFMVVAFGNFSFPHAPNIGGVQAHNNAAPDLRYVYAEAAG